MASAIGQQKKFVPDPGIFSQGDPEVLFDLQQRIGKG
jgi:hypothetical protein